MESLSVYRNENKYIIDMAKSAQIEGKLSRILEADQYSKNGNYIVRSLYFDTINNTDFHSKLAGNEIRKKVRLRIYTLDTKMCKLEVKQKNGELQHKIGMWISKDDAKELIECNYSVLTKYFNESDIAIQIYTTMATECYRPVVTIEYDRTAFIYSEFNTRITLDKNIRISESNYNIFDEKMSFIPIFNENNILEVKYNEKLMKFISKILQPYNLNKTAISKYCIGRPNYYRFLS